MNDVYLAVVAYARAAGAVDHEQAARWARLATAREGVSFAESCVWVDLFADPKTRWQAIEQRVLSSEAVTWSQ